MPTTCRQTETQTPAKHPRGVHRSHSDPAGRTTRSRTNAKSPSNAEGEPADGTEAEERNEGTTEERKDESKLYVENKKDYSFQEGVLERGHIYFFYRPKVEHEEVHTMDDVKNLHILLVPRPPQFATYEPGVDKSPDKTGEGDADEMNLVSAGADAVPSSEPKNDSKRPFRLLLLGKKKLPDPEPPIGGRKEIFWATVTFVGDDLRKLETGLGARTYETKTRGTRHMAPARLAARGAYAIVNRSGRTPSSCETHLGYHLSHPAPSSLGEVHRELGIHSASSFVLQVKNPLAPTSGGQRVGLSENRRPKYPQEIMNQVFGKGVRGRESYGLRFSTLNCVDLLNYEGTELLLIAAHTGAEGNDQSLGEGRGGALEEAEKEESKELIDDIFEELVMDKDKFPDKPFSGGWI